MSFDFFNTAYNYLRVSNIVIDKLFLRQRMLSHPEYPSLVSLTDTLDELGIKYEALVSDKSMYLDFKYPLLLHLKNNGSEYFSLAVSPDSLLSNNAFILNAWDGISLFVENGSIIRCKV